MISRRAIAALTGLGTVALAAAIGPARNLSALLADCPGRHAGLAAEAGMPELIRRTGLLYASAFDARRLAGDQVGNGCSDIVYAFSHGHAGLAAGPTTGQVIANTVSQRSAEIVGNGQ